MSSIWVSNELSIYMGTSEISQYTKQLNDAYYEKKDIEKMLMNCAKNIKIFVAVLSLWVVSFFAIASTDSKGLLFVPESNSVLKFASQNSDEEVDPFTGDLTLRHTDLVLPGTHAEWQGFRICQR